MLVTWLKWKNNCLSHPFVLSHLDSPRRKKGHKEEPFSRGYFSLSHYASALYVSLAGHVLPHSLVKWLDTWYKQAHYNWSSFLSLSPSPFFSPCQRNDEKERRRSKEERVHSRNICYHEEEDTVVIHLQMLPIEKIDWSNLVTRRKEKLNQGNFSCRWPPVVLNFSTFVRRKMRLLESWQTWKQVWCEWMRMQTSLTHWYKERCVHLEWLLFFSSLLFIFRDLFSCLVSYARLPPPLMDTKTGH